MSDVPTRRTSGKQLTETAKSLLKNVIRHTGTHNRLKEESEMWQQFYSTRGQRSAEQRPEDGEKKKRSPRRSHERKERSPNDRKRSSKEMSSNGDLDVQRSFLYDEREDMAYEWRRRRGPQHAHMDDRGSTRGSSTRGSTYWMRQLDKAETGDGERWGHSGFKKLYPKDFDSSRSRSRSYTRSRSRSISRSHSRSSSWSDRYSRKARSSLSSKSRIKKRKKEKKKKKKKRLLKERDSFSGHESDERNRETKIKIKKEIKRSKKKRKKLKRRKSEMSASDSDSDSEGRREGRRSWRNEEDVQKEGESPHRKRMRRY